MKFQKFTDPSGGDVWIATQWVTKVTLPTRGQFPVGANTVIAMGANQQAVREHLAQVMDMLEEVKNDSANS
jgi:hypothetical protein